MIVAEFISPIRRIVLAILAADIPGTADTNGIKSTWDGCGNGCRLFYPLVIGIVILFEWNYELELARCNRLGMCTRSRADCYRPCRRTQKRAAPPGGAREREQGQEQGLGQGWHR